ncbi:GntR family transcriptional regulator [Limnochorda pilosa]|uniref:GntR family transcriptional regulator n=1 Tax=Limnochorda pilosa TaxID=1555112 RepID=A0A0K2SI27_LIMPI|nr:GntR family transcriptional regulator [Limnochorda pilosa]BAS26781.1 GntR family transcriptional regulator [Limnochorda pilosa]
MAFNRNLPLYVQVKDELERRIRSGLLQPGDRLPSEQELAAELGVSQATAKHAIISLAADGLVSRRPGRGTVVEMPPPESAAIPLRSFTEEMHQRGLSVSSELLSKGVDVPETEVAWHLDLPRGARVLRVLRIRRAGAEALALEEAYIPEKLCPGLLEEDLEAHSIDWLLEQKYEVRLASAEEVVEARAAEPQERERLRLADDGAVVLVAHRTVRDLGSRPVHHSRTVFRADRYLLRFHLTRRA